MMWTIKHLQSVTTNRVEALFLNNLSIWGLVLKYKKKYNLKKEQKLAPCITQVSRSIEIPNLL